jgi:hypothetical protein
MPRNVRNFWLELNVDGSKSRVETGPRSANGGFSLTIYQRDSGSIVKALDVWGHIDDSGKIRLQVTGRPGTMGELDREIIIETQR